MYREEPTPRNIKLGLRPLWRQQCWQLSRVRAKAEPWMGRDFSIELTLPPLAAIVLTPERAEKTKHDH